MVKFLHTSDWQLGAAFGQIPGDQGALLRTLRLDVLDRIGEVAAEQGVDFVLAAGDLFDSHTIDNAVVTQACERIGRWQVPVYAIPGNHDFANAPESVYGRARFKKCCPQNFHLLDHSEAQVVADERVVLMPCPLTERHTVTDPTTWLTAETGQGLANGACRVAMAHGSIVDFESEEHGTTPNLINPAVVERASLDYLALGDWHGVHCINDRAWYCGTPEPDRFKGEGIGHVLLVTIEDAGVKPTVEQIRVSTCQWLTNQFALHEAADVDALENWFDQVERPERALVRVELDGALGMVDLDRLEQLLSNQSERLLHLRRRREDVRLQPTDEELAALEGEGLVGQAAMQLRQIVDGGGDDAVEAEIALQILFQHVSQADGGGDRCV